MGIYPDRCTGGPVWELEAAGPEANRICLPHGVEVVGHSQDIGSCRDMNRLGLQALTDAVSQGGVNILVVSGPDSLSRNAKDIIVYAEFLQNFGVEAYSPKQGRLKCFALLC